MKSRLRLWLDGDNSNVTEEELSSVTNDDLIALSRAALRLPAIRKGRENEEVLLDSYVENFKHRIQRAFSSTFPAE
ncbi:hypothetical protein [Yoonia sp. R2-816]|uniref:hypothetical protein n=1 Tax=Yoonia sp. R2-816 TaxID=3342638 RepID=UPI00372655A2